MLKSDPAEILRFLALLCEPDQVYELRALQTQKGTVSGYFNDVNRLAPAAAKVCDKFQPGGVYVTLNPVNADLLGRANNRYEPYAKHTTADVDVLQRRWLGLDFDPRRASGISSTDTEHQAALACGREARDWLTASGWPAPILVDSGNGALLVYRIDLPNDDAAPCADQARAGGVIRAL